MPGMNGVPVVQGQTLGDASVTCRTGQSSLASLGSHRLCGRMS